MAIHFACPQCGKKYQLQDELAGRKAKCQACQAVSVIPQPVVTSGGSTVYQHKERVAPFALAVGNEDQIGRVSDHIERHLGKVELVLHEIVSDLVHIDLHWIAPSSKLPYNILVTSGMSDHPMTVPEGAEPFQFAELVLVLPKSWPMTMDAFNDERNFWPIRTLKLLARLPHEYETWLCEGHTIPNGEPAEHYAKNTELCCALIAPPIDLPDDFSVLTINDDQRIIFWGVHFIYREEMDLKLNQGFKALVAGFAKNKIGPALDVRRTNVAKKRGWW